MRAEKYEQFISDGMEDKQARKGPMKRSYGLLKANSSTPTRDFLRKPYF